MVHMHETYKLLVKRHGLNKPQAFFSQKVYMIGDVIFLELALEYDHKYARAKGRFVNNCNVGAAYPAYG